MLKESEEDSIPHRPISVISKWLLVIIVLAAGLIFVAEVFRHSNPSKNKKEKISGPESRNGAGRKDDVAYWKAPEIKTITDIKQKEQVEYGKELVAHTAKYFGPRGSLAKISNGLNCQNCHLQAGTAVFAGNFGSVASLYPIFKARSGSIENIYKRVNDCFERSLNGKAIDSNCKEMQAIAAYIIFLGTNVRKGQKAPGSGYKNLAYLDRGADPEKGRSVYITKCQSCHQHDGEGIFNADKTEFIYPALWGKNSFNDGAGLYRLGNFAKYIAYNMPMGTTYQNPQLSGEEAWDVAAFVTTQTRPHFNVRNDWPDKSKKPVDYPFGPYADHFSENQHKLGPFKPIAEERNKKEEAAKKETLSAFK